MRQDLVASYKGGPQRGFNFKSSTWHALQYCSLCDSRRLASSALSRACRSGRNLHPGLSKRMCKAEAASITLAGGLSSMASLSSSSGAADQSSHSNPVPKKQANRLSIDPQASGDDIIVVRKPHKLPYSGQLWLLCITCDRAFPYQLPHAYLLVKQSGSAADSLPCRAGAHIGKQSR